MLRCGIGVSGGMALVSSLIAFVILPAKCSLAQAKPAASAPAPKVVIVLGARDSAVTPQRFGYSATGGGTVLVAQPAADTVVITMTGVAAAGACACGTSHAALDFALDQEFEVEFAPGGPQSGQLVIEARVAGLLRTDGKKSPGTAEMARAFAVVSCGDQPIGSVTLDPQMAACGEGLAVTSARGPVSSPIVAGCYSLHQEFAISATQPKCLLPRKASADFAPPPTLDAKWISVPDPFREANRTSNGFQVTIRVIPDPAVPQFVPPPPAAP